ncbi:HHR134Cp [Eremothecium sinecaudum]|uniref:HHR134Cp n=1 Tax=Eremothecium sinecaudum TaxID=45286 RepID=A0A109V0F4_9SACH|nr:HHR134Cp [Eremothecium sinecaudum]AMD22903.1 HHR134Cp [Eremothecium sinecaudum]
MIVKYDKDHFNWHAETLSPLPSPPSLERDDEEDDEDSDIDMDIGNPETIPDYTMSNNIQLIGTPYEGLKTQPLGLDPATDVNLKRLSETLQLECNSLDDQRLCVVHQVKLVKTTFQPVKLDFFWSDDEDLSPSMPMVGFNFYTVSIKLPRNNPLIWKHFLLKSQYNQMVAFLSPHEKEPRYESSYLMKSERLVNLVMHQVWLQDVRDHYSRNESLLFELSKLYTCLYHEVQSRYNSCY